MSLRTFTDSAGKDWQAFDVVPREDERRRYDRRSGELRQASEAAEDQEGGARADLRLETTEERREQDRRVTVGRSRTLARNAGWLCFEAGGERRRLSPIPADWNRCDDAQLEAYCRSARAVRSSSANVAQIRK